MREIIKSKITLRKSKSQFTNLTIDFGKKLAIEDQTKYMFGVYLTAKTIFFEMKKDKTLEEFLKDLKPIQEKFENLKYKEIILFVEKINEEFKITIDKSNPLNGPEFLAVQINLFAVLENKFGEKKK